MSSATVRISAEAKGTLRQLSTQTGKKMQEILNEAIELYRRRIFLEKANAAFAALRSDHEAWTDEGKEREAWDATLSDGLKE